MRLVAVDDNGNQIALPAQSDIPEFIKKNRAEQKMSFQAVADHIGVKRQAVWSWEHNKSLPTVEHLTKLVSLFDPPDNEEGMNEALSQIESVLGV